MRAMEGSGPPFDRDVLAPRLVHPTRVRIEKAIREAGEPLSASDLRAIIGDPAPSLAQVTYHAGVLVEEEVLFAAGKRTTGRSTEPLYARSGPPR